MLGISYTRTGPVTTPTDSTELFRQVYAGISELFYEKPQVVLDTLGMDGKDFETWLREPEDLDTKVRKLTEEYAHRVVDLCLEETNANE